VDQIAWNYEEESVDNVMDLTIKAASNVAIASAASEVEKEEARRLEESLFINTEFDLPEDAISPDLLSPIPSRNPSPRRLRPKSKSPARWKIVRSISDAFQTAMDQHAPGMYGEYHCNIFAFSHHQ
jgi:hypothetical protein